MGLHFDLPVTTNLILVKKVRFIMTALGFQGQKEHAGCSSIFKTAQI